MSDVSSPSAIGIQEGGTIVIVEDGVVHSITLTGEEMIAFASALHETGFVLMCQQEPEKVEAALALMAPGARAALEAQFAAHLLAAADINGEG